MDLPEEVQPLTDDDAYGFIEGVGSRLAKLESVAEEMSSSYDNLIDEYAQIEGETSSLELILKTDLQCKGIDDYETFIRETERAEVRAVLDEWTLENIDGTATTLDQRTSNLLIKIWEAKGDLDIIKSEINVLGEILTDVRDGGTTFREASEHLVTFYKENEFHS